LRVVQPVQPTAIHVAWDLRYLEIAQTVTAADGTTEIRWHGAVGIPQGGTQANELVFGRAAVSTEGVRGIPLNQMLGALNNAKLRSPEFNPGNAAHVSGFLPDARSDIAAWLGIPLAQLPPIRIQDLTGGSFEIHTVMLDTVLGSSPGLPLNEAYEAYMTGIANADSWRSVDFVEAGGAATYTITAVESPGGAVMPNVSYIVYMRPYQEFADKRLAAFFPTYVLVTTPNEPDVFVPHPTTPVLEPVPAFTTMRNVGVRWPIIGGLNEEGLPAMMEYEISWSEFIMDFPDNGTVIPWTVIRDSILAPRAENPSEIRTHSGVHYIYFQLPGLDLQGLFADTNYYVWARAVNNNNAASAWSNPVEIRTHDITRPPRPSA
jgi:hypothetical protein